MRVLRHLPNFLTCLNLLSGVLGIAVISDERILNISSQEQLVIASYLIFAGCAFDFFDGFAARWLKASSPIGKELDSLADVVTFGVLPGLIIWKLLMNDIDSTFYFAGMPKEYEILKFAPFIIPVFSALRLAKFNVDTRQSDSFLGLPTPANAIFIASLPLIVAKGRFTDFILDPWTLAILSIVMSLLLVSEIPLFALKFKDYTWVNNMMKYLFLISSLVLLVSLGITAIPFIIVLYILFSIVEKFLPKKSKI